MVEFGLQIEPQFGFSYEQIRDLAHLCESVGFNSLWCSDHLFLDDHSEEKNCWDAWTVLAALAVETTTLRLGTMVTCVSYRIPSVLAKTAACVDVMSNGRLDMGIGAGWKEMEYEAYGIPFPSEKERVDRFEEALNIILKMWTEQKATFEGQYHQVKDAFCAPKPTQKPYPPIWIGASKPRMLGITARHADAVNIGGFPNPETYKARLDDLRVACERNGRDFDSIKKSHFFGVVTASDQAGVERILQEMAGQSRRSVDEVRSRYRGAIGVPEEIAKVLKQYVDMGVEQFMLVFPYGHEAESVKLLAERAMPTFKE